MMIRRSVLCSLFFFFFLGISTIQSQTIELSIPDTTARNGEIVNIPIRSIGFEQIVSVQFSINWDPTIIDYQSFEIVDLENVAIGETAVADGQARLSWFDIDGVGESLPDSSILISLIFEVIGEEGSSTDIVLSDNPLPIQIFQATDTPGVFEALDLVQSEGSVTVVDPIAVEANVIDVACLNGENGTIDISLQGSATQVTYDWTGPNEFTAATEDVTGLVAGEYNVVIQTLSGSVLIDTSFLVGQPEEELFIESLMTSDSKCNEPSGTVEFSGIGGIAPYTYAVGDATSEIGVFENLGAGEYIAVLFDSVGCSVTDTFQIGELDGPIPDLGTDITLCEGDVQIISPGSYESYIWSTGSISSNIFVNEAGIFSVTVTDDSGCPGADTIAVDVRETIEIEAENDFYDVCPGDSIQLLVSGGVEYSWVDTSNTLSSLAIPNPTAKPNFSSTYLAIATNGCGSDTAMVSVEIFDLNGDAGPDTCIVLGESVQLNATGGERYTWIGSDFPLSNPSVANPITTPTSDGLFTVSIRDANNCVTVDSVMVQVASDPSSIPAINLITPNDDGKNDVLEFSGLAKFGQNSLRVFNRWGDMVYQKVNYQSDEERFDGTKNGNPLPAGNYYYVLSVRDGDIKQTITIVRD